MDGSGQAVFLLASLLLVALLVIGGLVLTTRTFATISTLIEALARLALRKEPGPRPAPPDLPPEPPTSPPTSPSTNGRGDLPDLPP